MPVIKRNIALKVPAEVAFRYLSDPSHFTEVCLNVIEISDVQRHPAGEVTFTWVSMMTGVRIFGEAEIIAIKHDEALSIGFRGGIHGQFVWHIQPVADGIRLEIEVNYVTPAPLLKKHSEKVILHQNEAAVEAMLTHLKTTLDADTARTLLRV